GSVGRGCCLGCRRAGGEAVACDSRERSPAGASPTMFLQGGKYDPERHHHRHLSVGVPGTVAGLHLAWKEQGKLPWPRLLEPAIALARDGFTLSDELARSLSKTLKSMQKYPASVAQFSKNGVPYEEGETLRQPDLAR